MQYTSLFTVEKTACAVVLSCLLATSSILDGMAASRAYAVEPGIDMAQQDGSDQADSNQSTPSNKQPAAGAESDDGKAATPDTSTTAPEDGTEKSPAQTNKEVPLVPSAPSDPAPSSQGSASDTSATAESTDAATDKAAIDRVATDVQLATGNVASKAGAVIVDGLKYAVNPDGGTAKVSGWYGTTAPKGDVVIAEKVVSGADEYLVTEIADEAFKDCDEIESMVLPDSLKTVGEDAFQGCAKLERFDVGEGNESFSVYDGMLFDNECATLIICPEGKQAVVMLPASMTSFEKNAFAGCRNLTALQVDETNNHFTSVDGVLYTNDRTRLLFAPARTITVTIAIDTDIIDEGSFAQCDGLSTIIANGNVGTIQAGSFTLNTLANATVALAPGDDYKARKAVWDEAGFVKYDEAAAPGTIQEPASGESGFVFQVLDDNTLAVSWSGEAEPDADLTVPTTGIVNGVEYKVSTIASKGFQGRDSLSSVQIRAPITTIEDDAFADCANLASIELPGGLASIGARAFSGTVIEHATIPASVSSIGAGAFAECGQLSQILTFTNNITVDPSALAGCQRVSVYAPYSEMDEYPWSLGLVIDGNHMQPYGVSLPSDPVYTYVDAAVSLLESNEDQPTGYIEAPEGVEVSYAYGARYIYVDEVDKTVKGKAEGVSELTVTLSYNGRTLATATRGVVVMHPVMPLKGAEAYGSFEITYDSNGGDQDPITDASGSVGFWSGPTISYHGNYYIPASVDPKRDGYLFKGWCVDAEGTVPWDYPAQTSNGVNSYDNGFTIDSSYVKDTGYNDDTRVVSFTLYASWTPVTYNVAFHANGGSGTPPSTVSGVKYDADFSVPDNSFSKSGYRQTGWNTQENGKGTHYDANANVNNLTTEDGKTVTLYAEWLAVNHTVTFNSNGGSTTPPAQTVADGAKATTPTVSRDGYTLDGWYDAQTGGTKWDFTKAVTADMNLFAHWNLDTYTIDYKLNGGTQAANPPTSYTYEAAVALPTPTKEGHTFAGWCNNSDLSDAAVTTIQKNTTGNKTLYAKWTPNKYTVAFDSNQGSAVSPVTDDYGKKITKPADPTREGYDFVGWYKNAELTNAWNFDTDTIPLNGTTLYAKWERNVFTVTFNTLGGSEISAVQVKRGETVAKPAVDPVRPGWAFGSWCTDELGLSPFAFDTPVTEDRILFASWTRVPVENTFGTCAWEIDLQGTLKIHAGTLGELPNPADEAAPWYPYRDSITTVQIDPGVQSGASPNGLFYGLSKVTSITGLTNLDTSNATTMAWMFKDCEKLERVDLSLFDTSHVTSFNAMFDGCAAVQVLDLASLDAANVANMSTMFRGCANLTSVTLPDGFVRAGTVVNGLFAECPKLQIVPENLTLPSSGMSGLFTVTSGEGKLPTYYAGTNANVRDNYNWGADGRVLQSENCTVTFKADGLADVTTQAQLGAKATRPADPYKVGSTFAGWYKDAACTQIWRFATDRVDGNVTLYSKWVAYDIAYEYPKDSGQYVYYDILSAPDGATPGTARTAEGVGKVNSPNKNIAGNVVIPSVVTKDGMSFTVVGLGANSFGNVRSGQSNKGITMMTLPETIETIGDHSLRFIDPLTSCNIPSKVRSIGNGAFYSDPSLTSLDIPRSTSFIDAAAFSHCINLLAINVSADNPVFTSRDGILYSKDMTELCSYPAGKNDEAFSVPTGVGEIWAYAMDGALFTTVDIPESVEIIGHGAFYMCGNLQSIVIPDRMPLDESITGTCPKLESAVLGASVTALPTSAFSSCTSLSSVTAYGNVTSIYGEPAHGSDAAFANVDKSKITVNLPSGIIGGKSFAERKAVWVAAGFPDANVVELTDSAKVVTSFDAQGGSAVAPQTGASGMLLSQPEAPTLEGKTFAGWYKDAACTQIWRFATDRVDGNITLYAKWVAYDIAYEYPKDSGQYVYYDILSSPDGDTPGTVRTAAGFKGIDSPNKDIAGSVVIPDTVLDVQGTSYTVVEIGNMSFGNGNGNIAWSNQVMTSISLPDTIKRIGERAFQTCGAITSLNIPSSVQTLGYLSLYGLSSLTNESAFIPASVIDLESSLGFGSGSPFGGCPLISSIRVDPDNPVFASQDGVLYGKEIEDLIQYPIGKTETSFSIPETVTHIGQYAFEYSQLESVNIPSSVTRLDEYAFAESKLRSISLPDSVSIPATASPELSKNLFRSCTSLESIELGAGIGQIPSSMFYGVDTVRSITAYGNVEKAAYWDFDRSLITVKLAPGVIGGKSFAERKAVWVAAGFPDANVVELTDNTKIIASFDTQGGSAIAPQTGEGGMLISQPETPTLEGKAFAGWYADAACTRGNEWDFTTWVTETTTLYAKWVEAGTLYANAPSGQQLKYEVLSVPYNGEPGTVRVIQNETAPKGALEIPAQVADPSAPSVLYDVVEIGESAFIDCAELASVHIPEGVRALRKSAFVRCSTLETVSLPATLEVIEGDPFGDLHRFVNGDFISSFKSIELAEGNASFCVDEAGVLYEMDAAGNKTRLIKAPSVAPNALMDYAVPNGVQTIEANALQNVPWIKSLKLPVSLKTIDTWALSWLVNLESYEVSVANGSFYTDDIGVLYSRDRTNLIAVPAMASIPGGRFEVPSGVKSIGNVAFERNRNMVELVISDTVTTIGSAAVSYCPNLTSVVLGTGCTTLPSRMFANDETLRTIIAKGNVTSIPGASTVDAFMDCSRSQFDVYLPETVGSSTFDTRAKVWTNAGFSHVGHLVDTDSSGLTYTMQDDFTLSVRAADASKLTAEKLELPATRAHSGGVNSYPVTVVEQDAFKGYSQLKELTLPKTVTTLETSAFEGTSLTATGGKLHVFSNLSDEGINEGTEATGSGSFKGLDKTKIAVDFAESVSAESKAAWTARMFNTSDQTFVAVTFDSRGGSAVTPQRLASNEKIVKPVIDPLKAGYKFAGWYADPELTRAWDFGTSISADTTLYAKWIIGEGVLPTVKDGKEGTDASWLISEDGTLFISCDDPSAQVADLGWTKDGTDNAAEGYWGPYRASVKSIVMQDDLRVSKSMDCWFADMKTLVDAGGAFVPEGVETAAFLFGSCASLKTIPTNFMRSTVLTSAEKMFLSCTVLATLPEDFALPNTVTSINMLFERCRALKQLPEDFRIPTSVTDAYAAFAHTDALVTLPDGIALPNNEDLTIVSLFYESTGLRTLPDSFVLPPNASSVEYAFLGCTSLESIPAGFIPDDLVARRLTSMFEDCTSLSSLSDNFSVPQASDVSITRMFYNCPSLTKLPTSLDLSAIPSTNMAAAFALPSDPYAANPLVTGYEGDPANLPDASMWQSWNRSLVLPVEVTFDLRLGAIEGMTEPVVQKVLPGDRVKRPAVDPAKEGYVFTGWYKDLENNILWDFDADIVERDTTIYSGWEVAEDDTFYCEIDGRELRFKVLSKDGAAGTGTVRVIRNDHEGSDQIGGDLVIPETVAYEGNTYTITEIGGKLDGGLPAGVFQGYAQLTSVVIPASATIMGVNAFCDCTALQSVTFAEGSAMKTISNGAVARTAVSSIVFPAAVESIGKSAFLSCTRLSSVKFNDGLKVIEAGAFRATPIESVDIPQTVTTIETLAFANCLSLTTVSIPASVQEIGRTAFADCPKLATIQAESAIAFFDQTAFDATTKQTAHVLLPAQSPTGVPFDQLAAAWGPLGYGFANVIAAYGALPTENGTNNGFWELTSDGTLRISVKQAGAVIQSLGWNGSNYLSSYWGPFRELVKRVVLVSGADATNMDYWFAGMTSLVDVTAVTVLPSAQSIERMFLQCESLTELPEGFTIPNSVQHCSHLFSDCRALKSLPDSFRISDSIDDLDLGLNNMFARCSSLESLPEGFTLPSTINVHNLNGMFNGCSSLASLPDGFRLPSSATSTEGMFKGCSSLMSLPEEFRITENVTRVVAMFSGCQSIGSLPEGFTIPANAKQVKEVFANCASLTALPNSFTLPESYSEETAGSAFVVDGESAAMYYAGGNKAVEDYPWEQAHRTLITPSTKPKGVYAITLNVKVQGESGLGTTWRAAYTNESGVLAEPAAPSRPGKVFTLWYSDPECTERVDFSQPFDADATIYGQFVAGSRSGTLPTAAGTGSAWWSLADDGTLYIKGSGKINMYISDAQMTSPTMAWGLYRSDVRAVSMSPSVKATNMARWFYRMTNLEDVSEVFVPEGATDLTLTFGICGKIQSLPEGFCVPDSVTHISSMFNGCKDLLALPSTFVFSEKSKIINVSYAFSSCSSLVGLPEGFTIPDAVTAAAGVFANCSSLTVLPDGFGFPVSAVELEAHNAFKVSRASGEPRLATYYNGNDPRVLNYDWESQNRTLITDPADRGMYTVTYKTMDESGVWTTRTTALTDSAGIAANPGAPLNGEYVFTGWCTDEACLNEFGFTTPLTQDTTLYGKWIKHGGRGTQEGKLPTVGNAGSAWWRITIDGALGLQCEDGAVVTSLAGWDDYNKAKVGYWGPYRNEISQICMSLDFDARDISSWFSSMGQLKSIENVVMPKSCTIMRYAFAYSGLASIPKQFSLPEQLSNMGGMFEGCKALDSVPADFSIPAKVEQVWFLFAGTSIKAVPRDWSIPRGVLGVRGMFSGCSSLTYVPENFTIPDSVRDVSCMFANCPQLTVLPSGLFANLSEAAKNTINQNEGVFGFAKAPAKNVETYWPVSNEMAGLVQWDAQHRTLMQVPSADRKLVSLLLPDAKGAYDPASPYATLMTDNADMILEPSMSSDKDKIFVGWFIDADCTTPFDFTKTVASQIAAEPYNLYAKYQENSGKLPTIGADGQSGEDASWEVTDDGTLKIHCEPGAVIQNLYDSAKGVADVSHWRPFAASVKRVVIDETVDAVDMSGWFRSMSSLTSFSGLRVFDSTRQVQDLFRDCSSLVMLPDDFTLPDSVVQCNHMFMGCSALKSLPTGFHLPSVVEDPGTPYGLNNLFYGCSSLETLPDGFTMPEVRTGNLSGMFMGCSSLKSLPNGFTLSGLGDKVTEAHGLFKNCSSLQSLPQGFTVPAGLVNVGDLFYGCSSLSSLPAGFCLEGPDIVENVQGMFWDCASLTTLPSSLNLSGLTNSKLRGVDTMFGLSDVAADNAVVTLYEKGEGEQKADLGKLLIPASGSNDAAQYWRATYHRALYAQGDAENPLPNGMYTVTFKTQIAGADAWNDFQTVLTDASGMVADPGITAPFGYSFMGWKTEGGATFDFSQPVAQDTTLYGTYTLKVSVDVPLKMNLALDRASGTVRPQDVELRSFTPVPLEIASITTKENAVADEVFPDAAERAQLGVQFTPKGGTALDLGINDVAAVDGLVMNAAESPGTPGVFACTIGMNIPSGTAIKSYSYDRITSIATIAFEVVPKL